MDGISYWFLDIRTGEVKYKSSELPSIHPTVDDRVVDRVWHCKEIDAQVNLLNVWMSGDGREDGD